MVTTKVSMTKDMNERKDLICRREGEAGNTPQNDAARIRNETRIVIGGAGIGTEKRSDGIGRNGSDIHDRRILIVGDHCMEYSLTGTIFKKRNYTLQQSKVKICHLMTFGKELEEDCRKDFVDLNNNVKIMLKSPSFMWFKGNLVVTLRVEILKVPSTDADCYGHMCEHLYVRKYDKYLKPIGNRDIITMRIPYERTKRSGPDDSRLFQINNSMFSLFAAGYAVYDPSGQKETQTHLVAGIWDYQKQKHFIPDFQKKLMQDSVAMEKNWVPLVIEDELYIVRHLDPLQIMKCKIHENCTFVKNNTDVLQFQMNDRKSPLRGGTAFEPYKHPYYIGLGHGAFLDKDHFWARHYVAYLIVLCVDPFRVVYVSDPVQLHPNLYAPHKIVWNYVKNNFMFPTGLMIETEDSLVIGAHINDNASMILRMTGIKNFTEKVIMMDKANKYQNPDFSIQNYLLMRARKFNMDIHIR